MKSSRMAMVVLVMAGCFPGLAFAGATGTLAVSVTVSNSCAIKTSGALGFGVYDPSGTNATAPLVAQSNSVQLHCTNGTPAAVTLGQGQNADSASTDATPVRYLANGKTKLNYQLYTSAAHNQVWDNVHSVPQTGTGAPQTVNIYGVIPAGQSVPNGTYTDTVVITVNY